MEKYLTSNVIMETAKLGGVKDVLGGGEGIYDEQTENGIKICRITVENERRAKQLSCAVGRHITLYTPQLWGLEAADKSTIADIVARELSQLISGIGIAEVKNGTFLIAGIGNRKLAPDSVGPLTADKINITRHIAVCAPDMFKSLSICSVCAVSCGVMGESGIETLELLKGIVEQIKPDAVIAIDALSARAAERLAATVQLSSAGISPGAGIGNRQAALNADTLGVPVIAIGVPTVISASTLIADTLEQCSQSLSDKTEKMLMRNKNFYVAPKECDIIADAASDILSQAVNTVFGVI